MVGNVGLITLCVVSLAFWMFPQTFHWRFGYQHVGIQNARKLANARKTLEDFFISHYALGKNANQTHSVI